MGKVVELNIKSRKATAEELETLYQEYPDLKRLLGETYSVEYDPRAKEIFVVGPGDTYEVDLMVELFLAIGKANNY